MGEGCGARRARCTQSSRLCLVKSSQGQLNGPTVWLDGPAGLVMVAVLMATQQVTAESQTVDQHDCPSNSIWKRRTEVFTCVLL